MIRQRDHVPRKVLQLSSHERPRAVCMHGEALSLGTSGLVLARAVST